MKPYITHLPRGTSIHRTLCGRMVDTRHILRPKDLRPLRCRQCCVKSQGEGAVVISEAQEARLRELETLTAREDWDCEGGKVVPATSWTSARWVYGVIKVATEKWVPPFVSPCGDGSVHMSWVRSDGARANLEVCDEDSWHLAISSRVGQPYERGPTLPGEAVSSVIAFLKSGSGAPEPDGQPLAAVR